MTLRLEGHAKQGSHGVIWEALPTFDLLSDLVERGLSTLQGGQRSQTHVDPLLICYQNAWDTLQKYNGLTDQNHEIYAAATLLNPCLRKVYFDRRWIGDAAPYIGQMIEKNRNIFEAKYSTSTPTGATEVFHNPLDVFLSSIQAPNSTPTDEFDAFINGAPIPYQTWIDQSIFSWWRQSPHPNLRQWAFDTLSIPAMSAEMERLFAQARRMITVDRNRLKIEQLEASLCMKHWLDVGLLLLLPIPLMHRIALIDSCCTVVRSVW
jgi:hypothetical protein